MVRSALIAVLACLVACEATAEQEVGHVFALSKCPGDVDRFAKVESAKHLYPAGAESVEAGALVAPLIAAIVKQSLSTVGERLKESAQEKTVDQIHSGDYKLYTLATSDSGENVDLSEAAIVPAYSCLIVLSRSTRETREKDLQGNRNKLASGYRAISDRNKPLAESECCTSKPAELATWIKDNYSDTDLPGLIAVIDVVPSETLDSLRLEPRYVAIDHSIREKSRDSKKRDFTVSIKISSPAAKTPISGLLKFEKLTVENPYSRWTSKPVRATQWTAFLPVTADEKKKYWTSAENSVQTIRSARTMFRRLNARIDSDPTAPAGVAEVDNGDMNCRQKDGVDADSLLQRADVQLRTIGIKQSEHDFTKPPTGASASDEAERTKHVTETERLALYAGYWSACRDYYNAFNALTKQLHVGSGGHANPFGVHDINVDIKEFRRRPLAEFLAGVLADSDLQKAVAERASSRFVDEEEKSQKELDTAYESAFTAAELAIAAYHDKPTEATRVAMDAAKRAANRLASEQNRILPYPEVGLWSF